MSDIPAPLDTLNGQRLGDHWLRLSGVRPAMRSGWWWFELWLAAANVEFDAPVVRGIFSRGGRGVTPWIEITHYRPRLTSPTLSTELDLVAGGLDRLLFNRLGELIPPGGHLMLVCEGPEHEPTYRLLMRRVPPFLTPLGSLLYDAGLRSIRFFYLPEGGWEGQQKLWAEKALDAQTTARWEERTARELLCFLADPGNCVFANACAATARQQLVELRPPGALGELVETVRAGCGNNIEPVEWFDCARRLLSEPLAAKALRAN